MDTLKEKFESGVEKCQEKIAHYFGDECGELINVFADRNVGSL